MLIALLPARPRFKPESIAVAAVTLVALGIRLLLFTRHGSLNGIVEYDDGPYVSSAILLMHGRFPYTGYFFVQPPGIAFILAPVAAAQRLGWLAVPGVMAAGRVLTAVASAVGVLLTGVLLRHRGVLAVVLGGGILAVSTGSIQAAHTVLLEPWLTMFSLAGLVALFDGDRLAASWKRQVLGGAFIGFAGATQAWAIVPALILMMLMITRWRVLLRYAAGVLSGASPLIILAAMAPRRFWHGVISAQIGPRADAIRVSVLTRLQNMEGARWLHPWSGYATVLLAMLIAAMITVPALAAWAADARLPSPLEVTVFSAVILVTAIFFFPAQFLYHFAAWEACWVALAIAVSFSSLASASGALMPSLSRWPGRLATVIACIILAALGAVQLEYVTHQGPARFVSRQLDHLIPRGSCVVSDTPSPLVLLNRLPPPGCPAIFDFTGYILSLSGGLKTDSGAARSPAVQVALSTAFRKADYVLISGRDFQSPRISWTPALRSYFDLHFKLIFTQRRRFDGPIPPGWEHRRAVLAGASWYLLYKRIPFYGTRSPRGKTTAS